MTDAHEAEDTQEVVIAEPEDRFVIRDHVEQVEIDHIIDMMNDEFDPFFGEPVQTEEHEHIIERNEMINVGLENDSDHENSEEDSDFAPDDNKIDDVEVDMRNFWVNIDKNVENTNKLDQEDVLDLEVLDNDKLDSGDESDINESSVRKNILRFLRNENENSCNFYIGQVFGNKQEAKMLIKTHAVETRRQLMIVKDDHKRVRAVCWGEIPTFEVDENGVHSQRRVESNVDGPKVYKDGKRMDKHVGGRGNKKDPRKHQCPWVMMLSRVKESETWMVKTLNNVHKCVHTRRVKHCTSTFLSQQLMDQIDENPNIPVKAVQEQFQRKYEVNVSRMKAFRAKTKALTHRQGDYSSQYGILRDYVEELLRKNPDSTVKIEVQPSIDPTSNIRMFKRIYVCLGSLKKGFKAIGRDLLGLDGAFMKGPYPGQILSAVSVDPNNGIYPVSYAVVEAENLNSWTWFLQCLGEDLDISANSNFTFISDRQKGILPALANVFPCAEHRYCLRHIHENMKQKFRGKAYKDHLWKLATTTTVVQFEKAMDDLKAFNKDAHVWLSNIDPKHWSKSHFSGRAHSDVLLNNMCEVFNSKIIEGRDKPIITVLEYIREYLMRRIVNVLRVIDRSEGLLTPTATTMFEAIKKDATRYTVLWNGDDHYQVTGPGGFQCVVDIDRNTCVCRRWEITGMPCKHAVAAMWNKEANGQYVGLLESFVHPVYRLDKWKEVYGFKVYPINDRSFWPRSQIPTVLTPPLHHKPIGRPKNVRKKSAFELEEATKGGKLSRKGSTVTCHICVNKGHNSRTCTGQS